MTLLVALIPLFLLVGSLLAGRYVGEARIAALAARRSRGARRPRARLAPPVPAVGGTYMPRGGRLVAASLARRGPPAVLVVT